MEPCSRCCQPIGDSEGCIECLAYRLERDAKRLNQIIAEMQQTVEDMQR